MEFLLLYLISERGSNNCCRIFFSLLNCGLNPEVVDNILQTILMLMKIIVTTFAGRLH
jgi:hypothetical protein